MMETLKMVAVAVGYITTIGGVILTMVKLWKRIDDIKEGTKSLLRSEILKVYYKHCDEEEPTLREYERQNVDSLYAAYTALRGNTFVKDIYEEMRHWHVVK